MGKKVKVLLVKPRFVSEDRRLRDIEPPFNLIGLATFLISKGIEANVLDLDLESDPAGATRNALESIKPDIVGLTSCSKSFESAKEVCRVAKESGARCVMGAPTSRQCRRSP